MDTATLSWKGELVEYSKILGLMKIIDLSCNHLTGEIPTSLSSLSFLSVLNLSFNNLLRKIPIGTQLQSFNASSYTGNGGLYGLPLTKVCPNPSPSNNIDASDGNDKLVNLGFYVSMAFGFIVGFWGVCGTLVLKNSWRHSFFCFFEGMNDWIYVHFNVLKAKINRGFQD
ncbi:receptor-like protein EIX2 [Prosopis cineraria]|uniref:receptor-like protein EIX2 n=1 Tax=Prosopis cineraria TaxID=364024 RepID=UPI00240ED2A2|nr:receptor-like protein EIX2 [Prosopis cineraria]